MMHWIALFIYFRVIKADDFTRRLFEVYTKVLDDNKQVSCIHFVIP